MRGAAEGEAEGDNEEPNADEDGRVEGAEEGAGMAVEADDKDAFLFGALDAADAVASTEADDADEILYPEG